MIFHKIKPPLYFNYSIFMNSSWNDWLLFNLSQTPKWKSIFIMGLWHIWKLRNRFIFKDEVYNCHSVFNRFSIDYQINSFVLQGTRGCKNKASDAAGPSVVRVPCWRPPIRGWMKLNTDGAWILKDEGGGGGVFRNDKGEWFFGYSSKYNAPNSLGAELYALREGLNFAQAMPLQFLEVETDAQNIKNLLNREGDNMHNELAAVLIDVARALNNSKMVIVLNTITRELNSLAHYLAKYAMTMSLGHTPHYVVPTSAVAAYEEDLKGLEDRPAP